MNVYMKIRNLSVWFTNPTAAGLVRIKYDNIGFHFEILYKCKINKSNIYCKYCLREDSRKQISIIYTVSI